MAPPRKDAVASAQNVRLLDDWLTSVLAFHALSVDRPWLFYEEVDRYLGPWGDSGYPIAYGKKYCQLFWTDKVLRKSEAGVIWVRRTLLLLQEAIKEFVLQRFRTGALARVTEPELRKAAFESHSKAYTEGGLAVLGILSPATLAHVAAIPAVEFSPGREASSRR